jgi:hypothetical protein
MLHRVFGAAAMCLTLAAMLPAQTGVGLPMNLVARTDVDAQERRVVFHLRDAAKASEFIDALVRLMDPKRDAANPNPLRARVWPPKIETPSPDQVAVDLEHRVPGLARMFATPAPSTITATTR